MLGFGRFQGSKVRRRHQRRVDIVTVMAPRLDILQTIPSLLDNVVMTNCNLRWVVHLDMIDGLMHHHSKCLEAIDKLKRRFRAWDIVVAEKNQGHPRSVLSCFARVHNNCIYTEDDKMFVDKIDLDQLDGSGVDYYSFTSKHQLPACTQAGYWSVRAIKSVVDNIERYNGSNIEHWMRMMFQAAGLRNGGGAYKSYDIGLESLNKAGLVRVRKADQSVDYMRRPDMTIVLRQYAEVPLEKNQQDRTWILCEEAYKKVVVHPNEQILLGSIDTEYIMFLSSTVGFNSRGKRFSALVIGYLNNGCQLICFERLKDHVMICKTSLAKRLVGEGAKDVQSIIDTIMNHPEMVLDNKTYCVCSPRGLGMEISMK